MSTSERSPHVTHPSIPQTSPLASYLAHKARIDEAMAAVLESGSYILGENVERFESEFASYVGTRHAIGVASGTDALFLALRAVGIGEGDLVVTVANTAVATASAIRQTGADVAFVDVDDSNLLMDPERLESLVIALDKRRPRAVVPVHLFGRCAPMSDIMHVAHRYELRVIEDCAQAHGAMRDGRKAGTWGDAAAFSFYPTKNLGALGDGGAVATSSERLEAALRELRQYGWNSSQVSGQPGVNSRLDALQAAVLSAKLPFLDADNARRREIAGRYEERIPAGSRVRLPPPDPGHAYHQFVIRTPDRNGLQRRLSHEGISTLVHYPVPIHLQPAFAHGIVMPGTELAVTEQAASEILSLPMYPQLDDQQLERICDAIAAWADEADEK